MPPTRIRRPPTRRSSAPTIGGARTPIRPPAATIAPAVREPSPSSSRRNGTASAQAPAAATLQAIPRKVTERSTGSPKIVDRPARTISTGLRRVSLALPIARIARTATAAITRPAASKTRARAGPDERDQQAAERGAGHQPDRPRGAQRRLSLNDACLPDDGDQDAEHRRICEHPSGADRERGHEHEPDRRRLGERPERYEQGDQGLDGVGDPDDSPLLESGRRRRRRAGRRRRTAAS